MAYPGLISSLMETHKQKGVRRGDDDVKPSKTRKKRRHSQRQKSRKVSDDSTQEAPNGAMKGNATTFVV